MNMINSAFGRHSAENRIKNYIRTRNNEKIHYNPWKVYFWLNFICNHNTQDLSFQPINFITIQTNFKDMLKTLLTYVQVAHVAIILYLTWQLYQYPSAAFNFNLSVA